MTLPKASALLREGLSATVHSLAAGHGLMHEDPEDFLRVLREVTAPAAG
jgi:pimeloyl-ACP methyl ester carboxylesterase